MCIVLFSVQNERHTDYPLILCSNRDEFFGRPSAEAAPWSDEPNILGGRDLRAGGTWFGINQVTGRFAVLTNYRERKTLDELLDGAKAGLQSSKAVTQKMMSRGKIVEEFLRQDGSNGALSPEMWLRELAKDGASYEGFNVLVGETVDNSDTVHAGDVFWYSNRSSEDNRFSEGIVGYPAHDVGSVRQTAVGSEVTKVPPGVNGLSNALLNSCWPKVETGRQHLARLIDETFENGTINGGSHGRVAEDKESDLINELFEILRDDVPPPVLPDTGIGPIAERPTSCVFVRLPERDYGTRTSTVLLARRDGTVRFVERNYNVKGEVVGEKSWEVKVGEAESGAV